MRPVGMVLLTGAAAVVLWKILAVVFFGLIGMALKVGLVILVVYFVLRIVQGKNKEE
jgi:predicted membrane protein